MKKIIFILVMIFICNLLFSEQSLQTTKEEIKILENNMQYIISKNDFVNIAVINADNQDTPIYWVEDMLQRAYGNYRNFNIVDRTILNMLFSEYKLQLSGNVKKDTITKIGNILGANYIVIYNETNDGVILRFIEVETARVLFNIKYYYIDDYEYFIDYPVFIPLYDITFGIGFKVESFERKTDYEYYHEFVEQSIPFVAAISLGLIGVELTNNIASSFTIGVGYEGYEKYSLEESHLWDVDQWYVLNQIGQPFWIFSVRSYFGNRNRTTFIFDFGIASENHYFGKFYYAIGLSYYGLTLSMSIFKDGLFLCLGLF